MKIQTINNYKSEHGIDKKTAFSPKDHGFTAVGAITQKKGQKPKERIANELKDTKWALVVYYSKKFDWKSSYYKVWAKESASQD